MPRVALVTSSDLPDLADDDRLIIEPLARRGIEAQPVVWDDPAADWNRFDLSVLRSTWDYSTQRDRFLEWARSVPRLANPAWLVEWNTDKRYLASLSSAGVPVVPTTWIVPDADADLPDKGEYVIKPAISAGARDTGRYHLDDAIDRALAVTHVERLQRQGKVVMLQPYLVDVDVVGETAMLHFGGRFSHAIGKPAQLTGPDSGTTKRPSAVNVVPREPSAAEREATALVMAALPAKAEDLLYVRIDLVPAEDGSPLLIEVEVTEPRMFLEHGAGAAERFADAIAARL